MPLKKSKIFIGLIGLFALLPLLVQSQVYDLNPNKADYDVLIEEFTLELRNGKPNIQNSYRRNDVKISLLFQTIEQVATLEEDKVRLSVLLDRMLMTGAEEEISEYHPLTGKEVILYVRPNGGYDIENEDYFEPEEIEDIERRMENRDGELAEFIYPNAVEVGDSWTISGSKLRYLMGGDKVDGESEMTLVKVEENGEDKIATIVFSMDITIVTITNLQGEMSETTTNLVLNGKTRRSLTYGIDRETTASGIMTINITSEDDYRDDSLEIMGRCVAKFTQRIYDKK